MEHKSLLRYFGVFGMFSWLIFTHSLFGNPLGFDMGWSPEKTEETLRTLGMNGADGRWLRIRGMVNSQVRDQNGNVLPPWKSASAANIATRRESLLKLKSRGHRLVAMLRWPRESWESKTRSPRGHLPRDLREAYRRCFELAYTYGDLIVMWEIENEPDISFVPENVETFAAFYKACALGLLAGREQAHEPESLKITNDEQEITLKTNASNATAPYLQAMPDRDRACSAVMHSPMALPPGPYWRELVANDVLSYTEAFNYHYYGYPEDFRGVRDTWINALNKSFIKSTDRTSQTTALKSQDAANIGDLQKLRHPSLKVMPQKPALPTFLTEYGYGLLDRFDRHTIEGRNQQTRFFELTIPFVTDGTISGAMAFVFMPYYERSVNEFGLLAQVEEPPTAQQSKGQTVTNLKFTNNDGTDRAVIDQTSRRTELRRLDSTRLSPVLLDFVAGNHVKSVKRYHGHLLQQTKSIAKSHANREAKVASESNPSDSMSVSQVSTFQLAEGNLISEGPFTLVLYNLSAKPVEGTLSMSLEHGFIEPLTTLPEVRPQIIPERENNSTAPQASASGSGISKPASEPVSHKRPPVPRSSLNPSTEPNWPTTETRIFTTKTGKTYAITPALELLLEKAGEVRGLADRNKANSIEETGHGAFGAAWRNIKDAYSYEASIPGFDSNFSAPQPFSLAKVTLAPMERRILNFKAILPNNEFRPHRFTAFWHPNALPCDVPAPVGESSVTSSDLRISKPPGLQTPNSGKSVLTTQIYPSPTIFRLNTIGTFDFSAEDNAVARTGQIARSRVKGESQLHQHPIAKRWLTTPGVDIEETSTSWLITVNDLSPEPLRPAEIVLPLPHSWTFPANAALSFRYRLLPQSPDTQYQEGSALASATTGNRFEEFDVNFRDAEGTLWSVWPRLLARQSSQSYLEPAKSFTPMFFSRASETSNVNLSDSRSLLFMVRPRILPATIEISFFQIVNFVPK